MWEYKSKRTTRFRDTPKRKIIIKEPVREGSFIRVPELKLTVWVSKDSTLTDWLNYYLERHPEKREILAKNYSI